MRANVCMHMEWEPLTAAFWRAPIPEYFFGGKECGELGCCLRKSGLWQWPHFLPFSKNRGIGRWQERLRLRLRGYERAFPLRRNLCFSCLYCLGQQNKTTKSEIFGMENTPWNDHLNLLPIANSALPCWTFYYTDLTLVHSWVSEMENKVENY